MVRMFG